MTVQRELEVLEEIVAVLSRLGIPYMLTGSFALAFYATPRMTRDIDVVVEMKLEDADRLHQELAGRYYIDASGIREAIIHQYMFNVIRSSSIVKVDFVIRKDEPYRQEEFRRRRSVVLDGVPVQIVSPEDLILSKLFWARDSRSERQLGDVRNLLQNVDNLDWPYLARWAAHLELADLLEEVRR
ncbi:MAG: nucleotidyltransferase family protein [Candidatus Riflebacteria bacterium]|nr:nucleotidyltransferase family protein [Candidatus Riflebacteria bacterium]